MTPIHPLIKKRESRRIIDPHRPVQESDIDTLLEAARWAPSCANKQPWRFVVSAHESLDAVKAALSRGNNWAKNAPLIISVASRPDLDCQITGRDYYPLGLGLAVENLLLQGIHLGLVMHPIAGFDEAAVKSALDIPHDFRVFTLIIIGHPGAETDVDDRTLEKEAALRERKPVDEWVFREKWRG